MRDSPITVSPGFAARKTFRLHCTPTASTAALTERAKAASADGEQQYAVSDRVGVQEPVLDDDRHLRVPLPPLDELHPEILDEPVAAKDLLHPVHHSPLTRYDRAYPT